MVDPLALAREWLPGNESADRPQITVATRGLDGYPAARTVLLTEIGDDGFAFHTDARSAKAFELEVDPRVGLVFLWPGFTRQLVVQGEARVQKPAGRARAYAQRSTYLKHLAWWNDAEFACLPDDERRAVWAAAEAAFPDGPPDPPPSWTGFVVEPVRYVFWESAADTASRRTAYTRHADRWTVERLPG